MQVKSIQIERQTYGPNKGRYKAEVKVEAEDGKPAREFKAEFDPSMSEKLLKLLYNALLIETTKQANVLRDEVLALSDTIPEQKESER